MCKKKIFFGHFQNLLIVMSITCSLVTWFLNSSCSVLSTWLLIHGVTTSISLVLLLLVIFPIISHVQTYGSLHTIVLTNLVPFFIFLITIIGVIVGWTIFGCYLYIFALSGYVRSCKEDDGRLVVSIIGSLIVLLNLVTLGRILVVTNREVSELGQQTHFLPEYPEHYSCLLSMKITLAMLITMGLVDLITVLFMEIYFTLLEKGGKHTIRLVPMGVGRFHVVVARNFDF